MFGLVSFSRNADGSFRFTRRTAVQLQVVKKKNFLAIRAVGRLFRTTALSQQSASPFSVCLRASDSPATPSPDHASSHLSIRDSRRPRRTSCCCTPALKTTAELARHGIRQWGSKPHAAAIRLSRRQQRRNHSLRKTKARREYRCPKHRKWHYQFQEPRANSRIY